MFLLRKKGNVRLIFEWHKNSTEWAECWRDVSFKTMKKPPKPIRVLAVSNPLT
jgi:hypothetical protein